MGSSSATGRKQPRISIITPRTCWNLKHGATGWHLQSSAGKRALLFQCFLLFMLARHQHALALFTVHDFQFLANVCAHALNSSCTLIASGLYFRNSRYAKSLLDTSFYPLLRGDSCGLQAWLLHFLIKPFCLGTHWGKINKLWCLILIF